MKTKESKASPAKKKSLKLNYSESLVIDPSQSDSMANITPKNNQDDTITKKNTKKDSKAKKIE
jgi:hypothetical protein